MNKIIYIMGVSGCGKTTAGKLLAQQLNIPFYDADDFHPEVNITKMKTGQPLNDTDRKPWLEALNTHAVTQLQKKGAVIACSALKESYRQILSVDIEEQTIWVYLKGSYSLIFNRMTQRNHFMPPELLQSQFDVLEEPENAITISIDQAPEKIVSLIVKELN